MREFIAACVQIASTPNDVQANIDKGVVWLEKAVSDGDELHIMLLVVGG